ncbi:MAG: 50S ribosomal protein L17 [Acidobacteria bacterium]|nr:MAG: 50S ribosomal protein L17 [Acidobacteriota bacterium]
MRHRVHGRKLGRPTPHRRALLRNLCTSLFEYGRITTTVQKAKELRPFAEKLITLGKKDTLHARRRAATFLLKAAVVKELFDTIAARYADRNGGYTRIIKLGFRSGDGADLAIVELLGSELSVKKAEKAADEKARKEKPRKESPEADEGPSTESSEEAKEKQSVAKKFSKKIKGALKGKKASKPGKATKARKDRPETT